MKETLADLLPHPLAKFTHHQWWDAVHPDIFQTFTVRKTVTLGIANRCSPLWVMYSTLLPQSELPSEREHVCATHLFSRFGIMDEAHLMLGWLGRFVLWLSAKKNSIALYKTPVDGDSRQAYALDPTESVITYETQKILYYGYKLGFQKGGQPERTA